MSLVIGIYGRTHCNCSVPQVEISWALRVISVILRLKDSLLVVVLSCPLFLLLMILRSLCLDPYYQAASRICTLKPVSLSNQGRSFLSFGFRSMPARSLRVSCAVCFFVETALTFCGFLLWCIVPWKLLFF